MVGFWQWKDFAIETVFATDQDTLTVLIEQVEAILVAQDGGVGVLAFIERRFLPGESKGWVGDNQREGQSDPSCQGINLLQIGMNGIVRTVFTSPVFIDLDAVTVTC
ncbi:MAG: hypothetical protein HDKAJFGB_02330 [Anaerolineae bacterium]|nr:hypothetical protein [Anaerolineae bacterium]